MKPKKIKDDWYIEVWTIDLGYTLLLNDSSLPIPLSFKTEEEAKEYIRNIPPYSKKEYEDAKSRRYDLDDWNDYVEYYGLGEDEPEY